MAGFLGAKFKTPDPNGYGWADKLNLLGAAFRDAGDPDAHGANAANVQQILMARQQQARLAQANAALTGLFGGSAPQAAPDMSAPTPVVSPAMSFPSQGTGSPALNLPQINAPPPRPAAPKLPSISDPSVIQRLLAIKAAGGDIGPALDILKANKEPDAEWRPDGQGGFYNAKAADQSGLHTRNLQVAGDQIVDLNDGGNVNRGLAKMPVAGANPVYDNLGHIVDWSLPKGAQEAIGAAAGATAGAQAKATAPYEFINAPSPTGAPRVMSKASAVGGEFTGQTPADASRTAAATTAAIGLPNTIQQAQQTVDLIDQLKAHPALEARTGWRSMLPAIPGTEGASFDAKSAQLKGKMFMEAYTNLKGAGQITEIEGKKATDAFAALDTHQTPADYRAALDELQSVIKAGAARAQRMANSAPTSASGAPRTTSPPARPAVEAELRRRGLIK